MPEDTHEQLTHAITVLQSEFRAVPEPLPSPLSEVEMTLGKCVDVGGQDAIDAIVLLANLSQA